MSTTAIPTYVALVPYPRSGGRSVRFVRSAHTSHPSDAGTGSRSVPDLSAAQINGYRSGSPPGPPRATTKPFARHPPCNPAVWLGSCGSAHARCSISSQGAVRHPCGRGARRSSFRERAAVSTCTPTARPQQACAQRERRRSHPSKAAGRRSRFRGCGQRCPPRWWRRGAGGYFGGRRVRAGLLPRRGLATGRAGW
jgi:hypothetical protein